MIEHIVIRVRKAPSEDGTHEHIVEVCTQGGIRHPLQEVLDSIHAGDRWRTIADGYQAEIRPVTACHRPGCSFGPYIQTNSDSTSMDNLENLDLC
jgi:hypothetical protein